MGTVQGYGARLGVLLMLGWGGISVSDLSAITAYPAPTVPLSQVTLQGLDKVTGRVFSLPTPVGQLLKFGSLRILVRAVYTTAPEETPETAAFLEIREQKEGNAGEGDKIFEGWMFASSPAISALEHPVYDIWIS